MEEKKDPMVHHPPHYVPEDKRFEHYLVGLDWRLSGPLYCATKYICRAGKKTINTSERQDLQKSKWYIKAQIEFAEKTGSSWGLCNPLRALHPSQVRVAWNLTLHSGFALMDIGFCFDVEHLHMLRSAITNLDEALKEADG